MRRLLLDGLDGVLVPGGFGERGTEGKIAAIQYARENKVPFFGICLGMQMAVVEYARNVAGSRERQRPSSTTDAAEHRVIDLMDEQQRGRGQGREPCAWVPTTACYVRWNPGASDRVREWQDLGASPSSLRVQQRLPRSSSRPRGLRSSRGCPPTRHSWRSSSLTSEASTRFSSGVSFTPSFK